MAKTVTCLLLTAGVLVAPLLIEAAHAVENEGRVASYRNERYGFSLSYPGAVFTPQPATEQQEGRVFVSRDGNARLLVGALANADRVSLRDYRAIVLQQSYPGAEIDYAPVRDTWFVLSGERDGVMFYERVTFTCGGRLINSWAMLYPVAERAVYDRIVEHVARSYRPGRDGCS
ncbi:MAG TPA: hypothetical protein VJ740_14085 [Hyphomicrobiaceae bacterium]|nr:hypothetical protein [Hyphomicrobiaceae bacterium]